MQILAVQILAVQILPVPPIPPVGLQPQDAPVPDLDARGPGEAVRGTTLTLERYGRPEVNVSRGFVPGSRFQSPEDRKLLQTPGLSVRVPLGGGGR